VERPFRRGPRFWEADIILEILDPKGRSKGPGEIGEMVLTALSREAKPLIRYRTGDLGAFVPLVPRLGLGLSTDPDLWPPRR
jgi:phenylacetate-coenzyme A ligase PaaK-like adenylate-forming protein